MKLFSRSPMLTWLFVASGIGIGMSFIPWGTPDTFHGTGFPFFIVAWDRSRVTGQFIDFPNILGFVLNPLFIFILGLVLWFCIWLLHCIVGRLRRS